MTTKTNVPASLAELRQQIDDWRNSRTRLGRMPDELWSAAVVQARRDGIGRVARSLRLGHGKLRDLVAQAERDQGTDPVMPTASARPASRPTPSVSVSGTDVARFVEVTGFHSRAAAGEICIELSRGDGSRMVVRLPGGADIDTAALCATFWSGPCCS